MALKRLPSGGSPPQQPSSGTCLVSTLSSWPRAHQQFKQKLSKRLSSSGKMRPQRMATELPPSTCSQRAALYRPVDILEKHQGALRAALKTGRAIPIQRHMRLRPPTPRQRPPSPKQRPPSIRQPKGRACRKVGSKAAQGDPGPCCLPD
jgi:hypothetical protein